MDMKSLLEKMMKFAGEPAQKPGDQVRGTEKAKKHSKEHPFKGRLVGDSVEPQANMLEELSQEAQDKSIEWSLAEAWAEFKEAAFKDTEDKRTARKGSRPTRKYTKDGEPSARYKNVEEGWGSGTDRVHLPDEPSTYWSGNGELQKEYQELYDKLVPAMGAADTIEGEVLRAASKIVYRHYNDGDEFNAASFNQLIPYIGKVTSYDDLAHKATEFALKANGEYHPNAGWDSLDVMDYGPEDYSDDYDEDDDWDDEEDTSWDQDDDDEDLEEGVADQVYTVDITRRDRTRSTSGTMAELLDYFGYTLEVGKSYEHERGRYKINMNPRNIKQLVDALNKAASNGAANGAASTFYSQGNEDLDEGWGAETAERRHQEQMMAAAKVLQKYKDNPEQAKLASYMFQNNWNAQAIEREMSGQGQYNLDWWAKRLAQSEEKYGPQKNWAQEMSDKYLKESSDTPLRDREDYEAKRKALQDIQMDPSTSQDPELSAELAQRLARLNQQYSELKEMVNRVKESRGHKIIARKLADVERKPSVPSTDDDAARAEQAKADYAKYVAKMKKKDPNFVPLYKMDENVPTGQTTMADKTGANDPQQAAKVAQATQALKSATGATAPTPNIAKALDAASQGKSVNATDMKAIEPMMDVLGAAAQDPKLANQFKTLANQARQAK